MLYIYLILSLCSFTLAETYKVIFLKGQLEVIREGKIVSPPIIPGDKVKLSPKGIAVLKSPRTLLKLTGETVITPIEDVIKDKTIINLIQGSIISKVNKKPFEVKTRNAVLGVRGTEFFVSSEKGEKIWMCVNEGAVEVKVKNQTIEVPKGLGVSIEDHGISTPKFFPWTRGIKWVSTRPKDSHQIDSKYNILDHFYD